MTVHALNLDQIWSWNAQVPQTIHGTVHSLISAHAINHPDSLAVHAWDGDLTYSQLNNLSWCLAQRLLKQQIPHQSVIPILFSKSKWTPVAMLGVIQAGCAAVALDATQPDARLRSIVEQTKPKILISSREHKDRAAGLANVEVLVVDGDLTNSETDAHDQHELPVVLPSDIVYISFTSGTTGLPKGARISHANVRSVVHHQGSKLGFSQTSRVFDFAPYSFDVAWSNFLHTLCAGGTMCIANETAMLNDLSGTITSFKATLLNITPTVLRTISLIPQSLKTVLLSGEMPYRDNITRWADRVTLLNTYGPTECTFKCAFSRLTSDLEGRPDIGIGVGHCTWVVDVDDPGKLAVPGAIGELWLEGPMVGQGYLDDPAKTAEAFVDSPVWLVEGNAHANVPVPGRHGRLYRTGDLVQYKADGRLVFMGRRDNDQLKIRGQRVQIGDVEYHVRACLDEDLAVIADVVMPHGSDTAALALFVQAPAEERERVKRELDDLEGKLRDILPAFMIPTLYIPVDTIPTAATGKVDRRRLRERGNGLDWKEIVDLQATIVSPVEYREPATEKERQLRDIWARVLELHITRISTSDSFLRLGGDSITAMYLVAEARKAGMALTVADVFTCPILSDMATKIDGAVQHEMEIVPFSLLTGRKSKESICAEAAGLCEIDTGEIEDIYPCTALQQGMLAISARDARADYTSRTVFTLPEGTDMNKLETTWTRTVAASPILRTRIVEIPGEGLVQVVVKPSVPLIQYESLREYAASSQVSGLGRPLGRAGIIGHCLALEMHHALYDGWTTMLILDALEAAYQATQPFSTPWLKPFQPFVEHIQSMDTAKATEFWRDQLTASEAPVFPTSKYTPGEKLDVNHAISGIEWPRTGTTPSSVVRSALAILLASLTNSDDIKYGATVSGRQAPIPGIERIVGPTIATVPVRVKLDWDQAVGDLLVQVQNQMVAMTEYEQFGLQRIQRIDENMEAAAKFELLLVVQPTQQGKSQRPGGLFAHAHTMATSYNEENPVLVAKDSQSDSMGAYNSYGMMIICQLEASGADLKINFDSGAIEEEQVRRLTRQFEHLLRQLCAETIGESKLRDLSLLPSEDLADIWAWNGDLPHPPTDCVTALIERRAACAPCEIAICAWDNEFTYQQVQNESIALARRMQDKGVTRGSIVVLNFEKSAWLPVTMLAVLQLGAIAVPVSAPTSGNRASQIVNALQPDIVITSTAAHVFPFPGAAPVVAIDELRSQSYGEDTQDITFPHFPLSHPALVLFTSGSTGVPKAIQWNHSTLASNIAALGNSHGIDATSRIFQFSGYDFDVSTVETLSVLAAGGTVCIASESERTNRLAESIIAYNANWICLTPSVAESIDPRIVPCLKTIVFAGEKLTRRTASVWSEHVNAVYNWYGPAEACVATSCRLDANWKPGVIGRSQAACTWLVDPKDPNRLAPIGAIAELCIEGPIVATYTGPGSNALNENHSASPYWLQRHGNVGTIYRTGDLVKYTSTGSLLFLGRAQDSQRKLRGQRIDLEDIERLVRGFLSSRASNEIKTVAEIFSPSETDKDILGLFFTSYPSNPNLKPTLPVDDLDAYLTTMLPSYMIPKLYIHIPLIPISKTGKTDRRQLRAIGHSFTTEQLAAMQPRKEARPPCTDNEKTLQRLWADVLDLDVNSIYATDHFLRLGGDSITAMRLVALARNEGYALTVSDVFEAPGLTGMAGRLRSEGECQTVEYAPPFSLLGAAVNRDESRRYAARRCKVQEGQVVDIYPCTALQEGLLALSARTHGQYISRSVLEIQSNIDTDRLQHAWLATVQKLGILRTCIVDLPGQGLVQVVLENVPIRNATDIATYLREDEQEGIGLGVPLCRAAIVERSFILTIHHCAYDGSSLKMLLDELEHRYLRRHGIEYTPFRRFIDYLQQTDSQNSAGFWKRQLSDMDMQLFPALPSSTYIPRATDELDHSITVDWPRTGITPTTILRSAWAILQAQYVGSSTVVFGVTTSGRQANMPGIERCSGPTIATVPITASINWTQTLQTFLSSMQQQSITMIPHEQYGLQNIQRAVDRTEAALFQTLLVVQPVAEGKSLQSDSLLFKARSFASSLDTRGSDPFNVYPLMLMCQLTADGVRLHISFDNNILDKLQIHRIACQFEKILSQLCTPTPDIMRLEDVKTASNEDINWVLQRNSTPLTDPQTRVSDIISSMAATQPDAVAIDAWDGRFSYQQVDALSTAVAHRLLGLGVTKGSTVALSVEKSKYIPVLQLAILKAGGVCLLQSVAVPEDRVQTVYRNLNIILAVASPSRVDLIKQFARCLTVSELFANLIAEATLPCLTMTDPAVILVSSGSTGDPKQILWSHRTLTSNIQGAVALFAMNPSSRVFQFASYDFDLATLETLFTLASGGTLCIPSETDRVSNLAQAINRFRATMLICTPSTSRLLSPGAVPTVSTLIQAGENLTEDDVHRWASKCTVINWYGPAECSLAAVCSATKPGWKTGVIALAPSDEPQYQSQHLPRCWLVDTHNPQRLVPLGTIGEVTLEGPSCAVAYAGNSGLTEKAFCDLSFDLGPDRDIKRRVYRTGDLARYDSTGRLIFLGRKDAQLKIRGQLVAPEEVEFHIRQSVGMADLPVVVDGVVEKGTKRENGITLVAFIAAGDEETASITNGMNPKLERVLPRYAIPSLYIPVRAIPTGPTGKIDRKKLREMGAAFVLDMQSQGNHIDNTPQRKPSTAAELKLQGLWATALGMDPAEISPEHSFLRLGNSIEAMRFVALARDQGIMLSVADVFEKPVLADMATLVEGQTTDVHISASLPKPFSLLGDDLDISMAREQVSALCAISEASIQDIFPCTPLQEGLLSLTTKREGDYIGRNIWALHSSVDIIRFKVAWEQTVARIPILRTRIVDLPGQDLVQVVVDESNVWTKADSTEDYINQERISLGSPLMRCATWETDSGFTFALTMHHSIYDGVSTGLVMETLTSLYNGGSAAPRGLTPFQSFIQYISQQDKETERAFWASQFANLRASQFPALPHATYEPNPDSHIQKSIRGISWRTDDIIPSTIIRAVFALLCARYSDSEDVVFGTVVSGRNAPVQGIDIMAGPTIATLPIRVKLQENETVRLMLGRVQSQATQMIPYEQSGLVRIQKANDEARQACQFQSFLVIQPPENSEREDGGGLFASEWEKKNQRDRYAGFSSKAIDPFTVDTMAHHFEHLLRKVTSHKVDEVPITDLEMITPQDLSRIWQWNARPYESVDRCIHDLITERAQSQPDATAICAWDGELTYKALDEVSTRLARRLVDAGVAVIKAGAGGLFLDPALPISRLKAMVKQIKPILMLASPTHEKLASSMVPQVIVVSHDSTTTLPESTSPLPSVPPSSLLYAVFTSGSTGTPKGVLIQHRQFSSAIAHQRQIFNLTPSTRMYDFSAPSFDVTYGAVLPTLVAGGTACIPSDDERKGALGESLARFEGTDTLLTPSIARTLDPNAIPTLRNLYLGGEAPTPDDLTLWGSHVRVVNCYGPAECSVGTVYWEVPGIRTSTSNAGRFKVPIGRGYGVSTWIVDPSCSDRLAPVGTVGELYLEGPLVGQGYFNDDDKTANAFVDSSSWLRRGDPAGNVPGRDGGRLYKTGDLVRYDEDGNLIFMGRRNTQVKLRGQRIELGEVEYYLRQVLEELSIEASVAAEVVTPDVTGRPTLVAFIEAGENIIARLAGDLESKMAERLPSYMVPATFIPINLMPLSPSGKTDRRQLCEMGSKFTLGQLSSEGWESSGQPPSTEQERLLQKWWTSVTGVSSDQIYTGSSFLRIGGDSISAMRLASLARSQGMALPTQTILTHPRLCDMAQMIVPLDASPKHGGAIAPFSLLKQPYNKRLTLDYITRQCNIMASDIQDVFPCTGVQKSLLSMTAKSDASYIARFVLGLADDIDIPRLQRAWEEVSLTKAPILRTRIVDTPTEGLVQVEVKEDLMWEINNAATVSAYIRHDQQPMGLGTPLTRLAVVGNGTCCLLTQHHAIYDGYSINLLLQGVSRVYAGLPTPKTLIAPFQAFVKEILDIDTNKARAYWENQFTHSEAVPFPPLPDDDYHPKADSTVRREFESFSWPKRDATASTLIRAAWAILTAHYTDTDDVVFGAMVTGRQGSLPGVDQIIAPLTNALPVRIKLDLEQTVDSFLEAIQKQAIDMIAYEQTELLDIRCINADTDRGSRFNTLLVVQPAPRRDNINNVKGPFDLNKIGSAKRSWTIITRTLSCFDSRVVAVPQMERMADQFEHVLRRLAVASTEVVSSIDVVSPQNISQLWQWNETVPHAREKCVHDLISEIIKRQPDSPAICAWDGELSYRELDMLSRSLASSLAAKGVKPGSIIPLCFEKSMWHPVAALGVMRAGAACVAMDSTQPESRLRSIVRQVKPDFVLTSPRNRDLARSLSEAEVVIVDRNLSSHLVDPEPPMPNTDPSDTIYVVFTSGSTGTPKGVVTTHRNFASAATHQHQILHISSSSRVFDFVSYAFDVSWSNILQTLIAGGCLCIPSESDRRNDIPGAFNRMRCDYSYFTPSVVRSLEPASLPGLKCLAMGGEPIARSEVVRWTQAETIIGIYGPAECAQALSFTILDENCRNAHVGRPFGANMWLVKPGCPDRLAAIGAIGELLIEGPTVSQGYFGDEEKTKAAYIKDPAWLVQGGRTGTLYKTGDLLRCNVDGSFDFIGRKDGMIKLRGQRIELAEVEYHVRACFGCEGLGLGVAAEIIRPQGSGSPLLAVFITASQLALSEVVERLEQDLTDRLPQYMIPGAYIPVEQIPMTTTNKTDRRALRELGGAQTLESLAKLQGQGQRHREPSTEMEKTLQLLWASVLGVEPTSISADSNFLRIGGESIAAMRLVAAARAQNLSITVAQIFKAPRLSQLALLITQMVEQDDALHISEAFSLLKVQDHKSFLQTHVAPCMDDNAGTVKDVLPATDFQKRAVLDALQDPPGRLPIWIFSLPRDVDFARLKWACTALVSHLEILHTVFIQEGGRFWQVLLDGFIPEYETYDAAANDNVDTFTQALCEEDLKRPRKLGRSLIRFMIIRHEGGKHRLVFRISHAQFDGYTWGSMIQALATLYHQQSLPTQPSFAQFMHLKEHKRSQSLSYWASRLQNHAYPDPHWTSSSPSLIDAVYTPSDRLTYTTTIPMPNVTHHNGISPATFFHAACAIALSEQFGAETVLFGRLVTGRAMLPASLQTVIGPTMTEVPVLVSIKAEDTIVTVAQQLQRQFIEDAAYEFAGMEEIIRNCRDWPEGVIDFGWRTGFQQEEEQDDEYEGNGKGFGILGKGGSMAVYEHELLPRDRPEIYATPKGDRLCLEFEGNRRLIEEYVVKEVFKRIQRVLGEVSPIQDPPNGDPCLPARYNPTNTHTRLPPSISNLNATTTLHPINLTFIGGGHLAQAILSGILTSAAPWTQQCSIAVTARRHEHARRLETQFPQPHVLVSADNLDPHIWEATRTAKQSILFICTRPADIPPLAKQLAPVLQQIPPQDRPTVVTMCPGITVAQLKGWLPADTAIVRTMPNTPVEERQGATGLFAADLEDELGRLRVQHVKSVLETVSPLVTVVKEEPLLDVVAAVSGSGPAHFFLIIESMVVAAEAMGLDRETAEPLVIQSCLGAGFLARASSKPVDELRKEVCVPGGSTESAIQHLQSSGVGELFREALQRSLDANRKMRFC
ncbi:hypothetical protein BDW69DRAFT_183157 [Aspergillus filifer]